jgi:hypothetical protein
MSAYATTITVTNTNDSGPGSLRQALVDSQDGDTIDFDPSLKGQTISLTSAELVINRVSPLAALAQTSWRYHERKTPRLSAFSISFLDVL